MDIQEFLLARIAEDEAEAAEYQHYEDQVYETAGWFDPSRVLRECAAKRAIIEHCRTLEAKVLNDNLWNVDEHDDILQSLAAVYSDHPDYQEEWKP